jgi:hypothetical protein
MSRPASRGLMLMGWWMSLLLWRPETGDTCRPPPPATPPHAPYEGKLRNPRKKKTRFFSILFVICHIFGRFSVRGVLKHDKSRGEKLTNPGTFLASEEPTNHVGVRRFLFKCPLPLPRALYPGTAPWSGFSPGGGVVSVSRCLCWKPHLH